MKIKLILGISLSVILVGGAIISSIWYFNFCENCIINNENENNYFWNDIIFSIINGSSYSIANFTQKNLLVEFAANNCLQCQNQIEILEELNNEINLKNTSVLLLTLLIDLSTQKELLDYYIYNDISWTIGSISEEYYSLINLTEVPCFYYINTTKNLIGTYTGYTNLHSLKELIGI